MTINGQSITEISRTILNQHLAEVEAGSQEYWTIVEELDFRTANPEYEVA